MSAGVGDIAVIQCGLRQDQIARVDGVAVLGIAGISVFAEQPGGIVCIEALKPGTKGRRKNNLTARVVDLTFV